jgi:acyl-coenzyme A synthetase/AMP-(fatty) acid ligase
VLTPEARTLASLIARSARSETVVATRDYVLPLDRVAGGSSFGADRGAFAGRSVVLCVRDMAKAAAALIDLDGVAQRILLCPPGWEETKLAPAAKLIGADALAFDEEEPQTALSVEVRHPVRLPLRPCAVASPTLETEWVLPTSGTSGPPKLAVHTLATLMGAIAPAPLQQWATFYDIRRYGGLQIFLRALAGRGSLRLSGVDEQIESFLARCGACGITHVSGTPTHWRMALFSGAAASIDPEYVRLSGEIADDPLLARLAAAYPRAQIEHAYASTEAGVAFEVGDGRAGFPAAWLGGDGPIALKILEGSLRVRTPRRALRLLGVNAPALVDDEDFVDTGDLIETRDGRCHFMGRRGGIINVGGAKVHPEEIEAVLNELVSVRASRVFARSNPITGAIVIAEIVLSDPAARHENLERELLAAARQRLAPHMAPAQIRFVAELPTTAAGKLRRDR